MIRIVGVEQAAQLEPAELAAQDHRLGDDAAVVPIAGPATMPPTPNGL